MEVWVVCKRSPVAKYTGVDLCPHAVFSTEKAARKWVKENGGDAYDKVFEVDSEIK